MSRIAAVIPSRWDSQRFPGKSLALIGGKPLLQWVVERTREATTLSETIVATDDLRIAEAATAWGVKVVMTRTDHPSGTDRVAEACAGLEIDAVINVQGDEPLINPGLIDAIAAALQHRESWDMVTAAVPIHDPAEINDPSVVKLVMGAENRALYFSRAPIPCYRDLALETAALQGLYYRHLGLYGYQRRFLESLVAEPPTALEQAEKLEQLRALHLGARMQVIVSESSGPGVDTPEDVGKAEKALREAGLLV